MLLLLWAVGVCVRVGVGVSRRTEAEVSRRTVRAAVGEVRVAGPGNTAVYLRF